MIQKLKKRVLGHGVSGVVEVGETVHEYTQLQDEIISLATFNLAHGRGQGLSHLTMRRKRIERNLHEAALCLQEHPVDVLALQEAEAEMLIHKSLHQSRELAERAGFRHFVQGQHMHHRRYSYGTALLSKTKVENAESHTFPAAGLTFSKGLVVAELESLCGKPFRVVSLHLDFLHAKVRRRQVEHLLSVLARKSALPLIVMGDFNCEFKSGGALFHLADELGLQMWKPDERHTTFPRLGRRLDWILISKELEFLDYQVWSGLSSDHLAVRAEVKFR